MNKKIKIANCKSKNLFYPLIVAVSFAWGKLNNDKLDYYENCQHLKFVVFICEEHAHIKRECSAYLL